MINPLNTHYSFTNPASIHDEESLTALELAGRQGAKINEVVRDQNALRETTENTLKEQTEKVIPETVDKVVDKYIEDGAFDDQIEEHIGNLEERLDNLLGSLEEGSTTMDAEVIDIRTDVAGGVWANAGASVRAQIKKALQSNTQASIYLNKPPVIDYVNNEHLTVTLTGQSIVFYNSKEYILGDVSATYENPTGALYQLLFNLSDNTLTLATHQYGVPYGSVSLGFIYKQWSQLNLAGFSFDNSFNVDSYNPISQNVYVEKMPTYTYEDADSVRTISIVFPDMYLMSRVGSHLISGRTVNYVTDTQKRLFRIIYDFVNDELTLIPHANKLSNTCFILGYLRLDHGLVLNGCHRANTSPNLALTPILMGPASQFVEFDSVNKTVKFPTDTLLMTNKDFGSVLFVGLWSEEQTTASWSHLTTSAIIVYYDVDAGKMECCRYDTKLQNNKLVLAIIRTAKGQVACTVPYKWDGKPFNMDGSMLDINMKPLGNYDNTVKGVGHRGLSASAPENTLSGYRRAVAEGFNYAECDVSFTSDGVAVLLHDATIDRTSNGTGNIADLTFNEVREYDFGSWFSSDYNGEQIPTFEEFIKLCREIGLHPYIELKTGNREQIEDLVRTVKKYGMRDKSTWISFMSSLLEYVKGVDETARLGLVADTIDDEKIAKAVSLKTDSNNVFYASAHSSVTDEAVEKLIANDLPLEVWTVNTKASVVNANPYVTGMYSDILHAGKVLFEEGK